MTTKPHILGFFPGLLLFLQGEIPIGTIPLPQDIRSGAIIALVISNLLIWERFRALTKKVDEIQTAMGLTLQPHLRRDDPYEPDPDGGRKLRKL